MKTLSNLQEEKKGLINQLNKLDNSNSHLDGVAKSFYLGMVGGSGKKTASLNKRRAQSIDKTISHAVEYNRLKKEIEFTDRQIYLIENADAIAANKLSKDQILVQYWDSLKVGDEVTLWTGNKAEITKKSKKSLYTGTECKWTASEIIGKSAAALIK